MIMLIYRYCASLRKFTPFGRWTIFLLAVFAAPIGLANSVSVSAQTDSPQQQLAHDVYKELIEINTVTPTGDTGQAADAMAARLRAAGFPEADVQVFKPAPRKGDLVARLRGTGARKPILLMAHLDVVEARREDWSFDPFKLLEQDGYFYGRGSQDDKFMASALISNLIRYKQEGFQPDRDIIVVLETDEEILDRNGVGIQWLIKNHRDLLDAEFALNEGGGVGLRNGKAIRNSIQTSEKVPVDYSLEVRNPGGHSSVPSKNNAIYHLAGGLTRLAQFDFPIQLNETTRAWLKAAAPLEDKQIGADMLSVASGRPAPAAVARLTARPPYNAQLRTTCVATLLEGGHADNALPEKAQATVNCRVLPGESVDEVQKTLVKVVNDAQVSITPTWIHVQSPPSPLTPEIVDAVAKVSAQFWPGAPVIPTMSTGASDGSFLRNIGIPVYGTTGMASDIDDVRAHGKDEREGVQAFYEGQEYLYRLVKLLASGN
jgi:acetylornithine deacetylase/succinyl-diaminopimelate desuccinylase-like protein